MYTHFIFNYEILGSDSSLTNSFYVLQAQHKEVFLNEIFFKLYYFMFSIKFCFLPLVAFILFFFSYLFKGKA